ncbi:MAG TPA: lysophospholipid acyltransferase family protein [Cryptosporangiaceae bacterium]|nr:lysophospholipid acyltransferase family protein [Cryptosporangiaceae bacterium]
MFYWMCKYILIGPWLRILFRPKVEGMEHVPAEGPAILASNHLSFCDSVFLPLMVRRHVTFLAKAEYFSAPGIKGFLTKLFFSGVGAVPIDRTSGSAAKAALETGKRVLAAGDVLCIYPEGTRSPDGRLYRGKTGVARMALEARVKVIPVAMMNTNVIQPIGKKIPRIMPVHMRIGAPLDFSRYEGMIGDRFVERSMTDEIMYALMQLSGQPYVDVYAAKVKSASPVQTPPEPASSTPAGVAAA